MEKFNDIDSSSPKHFQVDPVKKHPVAQLPDPWHLGKCICTALEKSDSAFSRRNIMYKNCPMNLGMVKLPWLATGRNTAQLHPTKLTMGHCIKDSNSRMDVSLTNQILSRST